MRTQMKKTLNIALKIVSLFNHIFVQLKKIIIMKNLHSIKMPWNEWKISWHINPVKDHGFIFKQFVVFFH